ncbi:MAPEG family protein [Shewanella sp. D64]|uniref:MAPEG family protein n=1 Tax=unclassified Shewanella TaxID=196818 RepID=UPI0022BA3550|nr:MULTISPECIES: MAPEG family protein [unclassified Shewanella]MEC4725867.1 MAPEG family protein [Shewanella sp. D64]MEC4737122.1 MAPEG family protein [Shewanella sp. E94]WBJ95685.1 MAPEG family protein [Shewanella sp. MTB7]
MTLSNKQNGVFKGMASAMLISIIVIIASIAFDPLNYSDMSQLSERLTVLGVSLILPTSFLIASIGRLAKFRFFSPEDIDGSGLTSGTSEAVVLQSLLQNTLEQIVITYGVYTAWSLLMPTSWLSVVPLCSVLFAIGRIFFFKGYSHGAPARAFGFALTFYSTVLMFLVLVVYQLMVVIS